MLWNLEPFRSTNKVFVGVGLAHDNDSASAGDSGYAVKWNEPRKIPTRRSNSFAVTSSGLASGLGAAMVSTPFVRCSDQALLVEAKNLNDGRESADRMRYGMGHFDYRVRYKADIAGAEAVLAFGGPPDRAAVGYGQSFKRTVPRSSHDRDQIVRLNERATALATFEQPR